MAAGSTTPGIAKLGELIVEHEPAITYDFRTRFGLSIHAIGRDILIREAIALVAVLVTDPTSQLQAAINGWKYPVSREWMLLARLLDVQTMSKSKHKVQPIGRPWPDTEKNTIGANQKRPQTEIRKILDAMKPKENDG